MCKLTGYHRIQQQFCKSYKYSPLTAIPASICCMSLSTASCTPVRCVLYSAGIFSPLSRAQSSLSCLIASANSRSAISLSASQNSTCCGCCVSSSCTSRVTVDRTVDSRLSHEAPCWPSQSFTCCSSCILSYLSTNRNMDRAVERELSHEAPPYFSPTFTQCECCA